MDIQIGKVTHYYGKLGVAVVEVLSQALRVGDMIRISGHDSEYTQVVTSLQVEHEKIPMVNAGESCGIKVERPVKAGDMVYLLTKRI